MDYKLFSATTSATSMDVDKAPGDEEADDATVGVKTGGSRVGGPKLCV